MKLAGLLAQETPTGKGIFVYPLTENHKCVILHTVNSRDIIKLLEKDGWRLVRVTGSHHHFRHPTKPGTTTVVHPKRDIKKGTLNSVWKQAGLK